MNANAAIRDSAIIAAAVMVAENALAVVAPTTERMDEFQNHDCVCCVFVVGCLQVNSKLGGCYE
jgi:hypothetical protein